MRFASLLSCLLFTISLSCPAQNYTFTPASEVFGVLEMEMYTEHYLYIGHDSADSAQISWRIAENTCPFGWDFQACDYQHCYTGLPNTGDMNPVAPGAEGYLRLIVNPYAIAGSGMLHFLIFPTGQPMNFVDAYFYFTTTMVDVNDGLSSIQESFSYHANELVYTGSEYGQLDVLSLTGKRLKTVRVSPGQTPISVDHLAAGCYLILTPHGNTHKIFISH